MRRVSWKNAVKEIAPYIVKIVTPRGSGTGFLCAYNEDRTICGIATAAHVVDQSHYWEEPIRIYHYISRETKFLRATDRGISLDSRLDTAVILFAKGKSPLPGTTPQFIPEGKNLQVGTEIGWVGFPSLSPANLCFFTGITSCWLPDTRTYLVDGVAINGVSGGPAFRVLKKNIQVIGSVSAYLPNRVSATPGLAVISDVDQYLDMIKRIKDIDEAKKKETATAEPTVEQKSES